MALTPDVTQSLAVGHRRARIAAALLGACAVLNVVQAVSFWMQASLLERIRDGIPDPTEVYEANDRRVNTLMVLGVVLVILTAVFFLRWLYRACTLAAQLNPGKALGLQPGAAVGSFFIPFVNIVKPVMVVRALDRAAEPDPLPLPTTTVDNPGAGYREPARTQVVVGWSRVRAPIALWWAFYLLPNLERFFVPSSGFGASPGDLAFASWVAVAFRVVTLVAAVLAIAVVRGIDARMAERARRLAALPDDAAAVAL